MRRLLAAVFVILALFAVSNVYAGELSATKCTVTAGKTEGYDTIIISGEMNATADDLSDADNIQVTVDSEDIVNLCVQSFLINETTFKKGKYKCSKTENSSKTSFTFDTKTSKFSFTAKNVDLFGLGCPLTIEIEIGDYIAEAEVDEAVVNGSKKPIPIKLMMGIKNVLRVDSYKVTQGKKPSSDQLTVKGGFAVEDTSVNLVDEEFVVTLDSQTFTLPAGSFKANKKKDKFTCSKVDVTEGGIASAMFNFTTCSFTITIKNTEIEADAGGADFGLEFGDFNVTQPLCTFTISPTAKSFTASGGDGSVTVTTFNRCDWTATSHASWIIITSGSSGSGSGTAVYSVAANGGTAKRTGTMTISGHTFTVTQAKPTAVPTGVTASAGDGQVSISWSAVSSATSYNIYWSTTSGVTKTNGTKITDATRPYSHTGLTNGTTYYYVVTAVSSAGESAESSEISAKPQAAGDVAAVLQNTGPFGALMVNKDGEMLLPIVDRDASGEATKVTGALYVNSVTGTSVVVYLGDDGRPTKTVMGDYILLFSNWSADGKTVDIAKIYTPTNYIEVFKGANVNANLAASHSVSLSSKATCFPACDTDTKNLAELLKIAGLGISVGACGVATTVSLGAAALPCAAVIVSTASLVVGNEEWLGKINYMEDIFGSVDVFQCVLLDPLACISVAIDMSSRTFNLLDLTLNGNSGLVTTANIFLSNPDQPSGVVQQGGGLPSCPDIYECTPGGAMSYLPCYPEGVRQCGASCTWGPCVGVCGDGICDATVAGENSDNCPQDCPPAGYCGDGICDPDLGESTTNCPGDCPLSCGDGFCNVAGGELQSCPQDCPQSQCCIDTDGCPPETPYECPGACCCCPWGQTCCYTEVGWVCCGG